MSETKTHTDGVLATSSTVIYEPGRVVTTYEHCAGEVRWLSGALQQAWDIHYIGTTGAIEKTSREWRDVPAH